MDHLIELYHLNHLLRNNQKESPEGETPGRPIWERDKNRLIRANVHKMLYALTCGHHQQPVNTKQIYINRQMLNYKQLKRKLHEGEYSTLNKMRSEQKIPTVADLRERNLARFITLDANNCGF